MSKKKTQKQNEISTVDAPTLYGWVCPKCGAVIAPWGFTCPYCSISKSPKITWTGIEPFVQQTTGGTVIPDPITSPSTTYNIR